MEIRVEDLTHHKARAQVLFVGAFSDDKKPLDAFLKHEKFEGKKGEILLINTQENITPLRICYLGLGEKARVDMGTIRDAMACGIRKVLPIKPKELAASVRADSLPIADVAQAIVEGIILGGYRFPGFHKKKEEIFRPYTLTLLIPKAGIKDAITGAKLGKIMAEAENSVRDHVNSPSNMMTPEFLADYAKKLSKTAGLKCAVLDPEEEGMALITAVAKGSIHKPKLVVIKHNGGKKKDKEVIGLIGKGITFDSGGISIKPSNMMWEMRTDMAGAAAVIEAMAIIAKLRIPKNIIAVVPLAENMPDGGALKPGDVVNSLDGTTIEIISTDAEGRMILADAITYAKSLGVTKLFDCATLTGGCITALGDVASGVLGNNTQFIDEILDASERSGQKMWHLPLFPEYKDYLKSHIADMKNCMDKGMASPSTGAEFLHKFVGDTTWVHVDIAGTAHLNKTRGCYIAGATGVPMRTIIEWLKK